MLLKRIEEALRKQAFVPTPLAAVVNPFFIIRRGLFKAISGLAPNVRGDILDVGCGSKPYESLFAHAGRYVGVDIAVSGHDHKDSKVDIYYDGKVLPAADRQFDAVVSFEVFEHVFDIDGLLAEVHRVLRPEGLLLISVPFAWDEHEAPYDFARYTSFGLKAVLERNGFEVIELKKTTSYCLAVCQMFIAYLAQYVFPRAKIPRGLFQLAVLFPLTLLAYLLDAVLPRRYEYFSDAVVLSRRVARSDNGPPQSGVVRT